MDKRSEHSSLPEPNRAAAAYSDAKHRACHGDSDLLHESLEQHRGRVAVIRVADSDRGRADRHATGTPGPWQGVPAPVNRAGRGPGLGT